MRFSGRIYKEGAYWLAEVPLFEAMTQGRTRQEGLEMIEDWFSSMVDRNGFRVQALPVGDHHFEIVASDLEPMIALLLQRQRQQSGLSLADVAQRLGAKSRNAYARYERGDSLPTVTKLDELLRAISPDRDFVLHQSST
jgi:DNA-binding XRE family transcriptional regulator